MPFILGAATTLPGVMSSIKQGVAAGKVKKQDTTPQAFKDKMAFDKQAAAAGCCRAKPASMRA